MFFAVLIQACGNKNSSSEYSTEESANGSSSKYEDGTYSADVTYYNPSTGTRKTYELNVDVENNEVTVIHFPNGGWLDESHISPESLDDNGYCSYTSDRNNQYEIQITGNERSYTDASKMRRDKQQDDEKIICSKCGQQKYEYDEYCSDCKNKIEKTCKKCGQYDSFMYSSDEQCSDCEEKEKSKQEEEENEARKKGEEEVDN